MRIRPIVLAFVVLLLDCATFDPLPASTCGNGVVDVNTADPKASEDCDTFPRNQCGTAADGPGRCRLLCNRPDPADPARQLVCPDGWGCGVDDICRAPKGDFAPSSAPFSSGVTRMLVGDFDGDRRADILGTNGTTSKGRIHYFDSAEPQIVPLPGVVAAPVVYDFDEDGRSDIAFGYSFKGPRVFSSTFNEINTPDGLGLFLGQRDRAVVAKPYPILSVAGFDPFIVSLFPDALGQGLPPGAEAFVSIANVPEDFGPPIPPGLWLLAVGGQGGLPPFRRQLAGKLAGPPLRAPVSSAKVLEVASSSCGEVLIALNEPPRIEVYSPCLRIDEPVRLRSYRIEWGQEVPAITIPVESSREISGHFVADVNGDGHQDVIIGSRLAGTGGPVEVKIAYGTGTGFGAPVPPPAALAGLNEVPLAAGLINRGDHVDLVLPDGVLMSIDPENEAGPPPDGGAETTWLKIRSPKRWTTAEVADLNRDGALDVAGASQYEADIDVLQGTFTVTMTPFTVSTAGAVSQLAITDFDFDGTNDIAAVTTQGGSTEIGIAYGRVLTMPPETPRPAGRLDGIRQIFLNPAGLGITTVTTAESVTTFNLAVLLKSPERQPVAPLLFDGPDEIGTVRRELATRDLVISRGDGAVDLVAFVKETQYDPTGAVMTGPSKFAVFVADGTGQATFQPPIQRLTLERLPLFEPTTDRLLSQSVAGDLGGALGWQTVVVSPNQASANAPKEPGSAIRLITPGGPQEDDNRGPGGPPGGMRPPIPGIESIPPVLVVTDREPYGGSRIDLLDIDGDGHLDLVTLLRRVDTQLPVVSILFGTGTGTFVGPGTFVELPPPIGKAAIEPRDLEPVGFAQITTHAGTFLAPEKRRQDLVVLTTKYLYRVAVGPDRKAVGVESPIFGAIASGFTIAVGDYDGDGVQDIAISDQGSIRIARQNPVTP